MNDELRRVLGLNQVVPRHFSGGMEMNLTYGTGFLFFMHVIMFLIFL
jgi:hypothetical protein